MIVHEAIAKFQLENQKNDIVKSSIQWFRCRNFFTILYVNQIVKLLNNIYYTVYNLPGSLSKNHDFTTRMVQNISIFIIMTLWLNKFSKTFNEIRILLSSKISIMYFVNFVQNVILNVTRELNLRVVLTCMTSCRHVHVIAC